MTEAEFRALRTGDVIANKQSGKQHRLVEGHRWGEGGIEHIRRQQVRGWGPRVFVYSHQCAQWRVVRRGDSDARVR